MQGPAPVFKSSFPRATRRLQRRLVLRQRPHQKCLDRQKRASVVAPANRGTYTSSAGGGSCSGTTRRQQRHRAVISHDRSGGGLRCLHEPYSPQQTWRSEISDGRRARYLTLRRWIDSVLAGEGISVLGRDGRPGRVCRRRDPVSHPDMTRIITGALDGTVSAFSCRRLPPSVARHRRMLPQTIDLPPTPLPRSGGQPTARCAICWHVIGHRERMRCSVDMVQRKQ